MAMEAAVDIDSAGDFSVHSSHSGAGSRSRSSAYSSAGITGVDVESGEAALLAGSKGHRSTYAKLAEEALLGAAGPPTDPEGAFERSFDAKQPVEIVAPEYQDAIGSTWRGSFWRLDMGSHTSTPAMPARCCMSTAQDDTARCGRTPCKGAWWAPVAIAVVSVLIVVACWDLRSRLGAADVEATGQPMLNVQPKHGCCTSATAPCFACRADMSVEAFCETQGRAHGILGCEVSDADTPGKPRKKPQAVEDKSHCCKHRTAECMACEAGQSTEQYCLASSHANVTGCGKDRCGFIENDIEYPGGDLYSVGGVPTSSSCCTLCRQEPKCTSWSWGGSDPDSVFKDRCFLKRQAALKAKPFKGYVSGLPRGDHEKFQIKSRHGICLDVRESGLELQACGGVDKESQQFVFQRRLQRIATVSGDCLEASDNSGGKVLLRPCDSSRGSQRWRFNSSLGLLRSGEKLCVHAPHRKREGGEVEMQPCQADSESQEWGFWSSLLLGQRSTIEAMREAALEPTTTTEVPTTTTVATTRTTTTTTHEPTLYCFSVMVSWGYEPNLVDMQAREGRSIFTCDAAAVYSDKVMDLADGAITTRKVHGTDLKCVKGGIFNTLLNTPVFIKVWEQVIADGVFRDYDWIIKVDCDAVFFPDRLRTMVKGPALEGAQDGNGIFLNNCHFGLHGPLEVVSRKALTAYAEGYLGCDHPPQEDVYLQACMNKLGAKQVNQFTLLSEDHCRTPGWQLCQSEHVAFHPFKDLTAYRECEGRAHHREQIEVKK